MESEDSTRFTDSLRQDSTSPGLDASKDLAIPSELEEPINLSVKKPPLVPVINTSMALQQYRNPKGEAQVSSLLFVLATNMSSALPGDREVRRQALGVREQCFSPSLLSSLLPSRTDLLVPVLFSSLWPGLIQAWPRLSSM